MIHDIELFQVKSRCTIVYIRENMWFSVFAAAVQRRCWALLPIFFYSLRRYRNAVNAAWTKQGYHVHYAASGPVLHLVNHSDAHIHKTGSTQHIVSYAAKGGRRNHGRRQHAQKIW